MSESAARESTTVSSVPRVVHFGVFEADLSARELRRRGVKVRLPDQPFQVLALLLERPGDVVTREELRQRLWPADTFVEFDLSLNSAVRKLRDALGDSADQPTFVETLPRRGYRFIAPVARPAASVVNPPGPESRSDRSRLRPRWWIAAALVTIAASGFVVELGRGRSRTAQLPRIRTIAVLPLVNKTGDSNRQALAEGLTEELITELAQLRIVDVIAQNSSMLYKNSTKQPPEIGRELNVDGLVEGSLTLLDDTLRVDAQLIPVATNQYVWAQHYDGAHLASLPSAIARGISTAIGGQSSPSPTSASSGIPSNEAYQLYLNGLAARSITNYESFVRAVAYFDQAIEKDPNFAEAYSSLALAQLQLLYGGPLAPDEVLPKAKKAADRALKLDPTLKEAQHTLAVIRRVYGEPASGTDLISQGKYQEALAAAQKASRLDPLSIADALRLARAYRAAGDQASAVFQLQRAIDMDKARADGWFQLGVTYALAGDMKAAIPAFSEAVDRSTQHNPRFRAYLGYAYAMDGQSDKTRQILQELVALRERQYVSSFGIALLQYALGEDRQAFTALERASREHAVEFIQLDQYPQFKRLENRPGYRQVMHLSPK